MTKLFQIYIQKTNDKIISLLLELRLLSLRKE